MNLKNKKLLVLGGTSYYPYIREYADKKGFEIYLAGKSDSEVSRSYFDRCFKIDAIDKDAISDLVKKENIDGIVALGNEDIINCVIDVCEECGLPYYISRDHWEELQNKQNFKKHCKEFDIDVVEEYSVTETVSDEELQALPYPIVLKPADGCGSQGVTICYDHLGVKKAMENTVCFIPDIRQWKL